MTIPWCPRVNAVSVPLPNGGFLYCFGDTLRVTKRGEEYLQFSVALDVGGLRLVIAGFRLMRGQIHPPSAQKFKTYFVHFWAGQVFRENLHLAVKQIKRHLTLEDEWDKSTNPMMLSIIGLEKLAEKCDNREVIL